MCLVELALQNIVYQRAEILGRRHGIREFPLHIEILQVVPGDNFPLHAFVEVDQIADHAILIHLAAEGDFEHVIMAVSVRVITLPVSGPVLVVRHLRAVQAM